jgi:hypothetical protein
MNLFFPLGDKKTQPLLPQKRPLPFLKRIFFGKIYKIKKAQSHQDFEEGKKKVKIADLDNRFKHVVKNLKNRTFLCDL